jgi:hypothetical protein
MATLLKIYAFLVVLGRGWRQVQPRLPFHDGEVDP